jgi:Ni/Co efflux regulator RcnB
MQGDSHMPKISTSALAAAITAGLLASMAAPQAFAEPRHGDQHGAQHGPMGHGPDRPGPGGRWSKGQHFDARYATQYQAIDYRRYHGLRAPPRGYHWVRSGNDAVLVAITTGIVASVIANAAR